MDLTSLTQVKNKKKMILMKIQCSFLTMEEGMRLLLLLNLKNKALSLMLKLSKAIRATLNLLGFQRHLSHRLNPLQTAELLAESQNRILQ